MSEATDFPAPGADVVHRVAAEVCVNVKVLVLVPGTTLWTDHTTPGGVMALPFLCKRKRKLVLNKLYSISRVKPVLVQEDEGLLKQALGRSPGLRTQAGLCSPSCRSSTPRRRPSRPSRMKSTRPGSG